MTFAHREEFKEWTESEKAEKIVRVMDGLEGEVCLYLTLLLCAIQLCRFHQGVNQIEQLTDLKNDILLDNALDWKKFKILVAVCCSYMVCTNTSLNLSVR